MVTKALHGEYSVFCTSAPRKIDLLCEPMQASADETFQKLCLRVADETDPHKLELLKQRLRLLSLNEEQHNENKEETARG
jgi:hypothetical protein